MNEQAISRKAYDKLIEITDDDDYSIPEVIKILKRFPDRKDSVSGAGIEFLPSSVDGLFEKLALLSGEYKAGNTTTSFGRVT